MSSLAVVPQQNAAIALRPNSLEDVGRLAAWIAKSNLAPKAYQGRPEDCAIAIMMGLEVGLSPMQAIQNITNINGRPSLWGDAMLAVCQSSPDFEDIQETDDGDVATCMVKRRGRSAVTRSFSMDEAKRAGLLGKDPWIKYPARMRQMRARGFALRDSFADRLRGIGSAEEAQDLPQEPARAEVISTAPAASEPAKSAVEKAKQALRAKKSSEQPVTLEQVLDIIDMAQTLAELDRGVAPLAKKLPEGDQARAREAFKARKLVLREREEQEPPHDDDGVVTDEPPYDDREPGDDDR